MLGEAIKVIERKAKKVLREEGIWETNIIVLYKKTKSN
jgi:hypothetical protein